MGKNKTVHESEKHTIGRVKIPISYTFLFLLLAIASTYILTKISYSNPSVNMIDTSSLNSPYTIKRLMGFKFIRPLLSAKPVYECEQYGEIKKKISDLIIKYQDQGIISTASIYLRDFDKSNWTVINPTQQYHPGSIMKIPVMMTILKTDEEHTGYLNEMVSYNVKLVDDEHAKQTYLAKQVEYGKIYNRRQLVENMIENSDNAAAQLLILNSFKENTMIKMYQDFGLPKLDTKSPQNNLLTVQGCSSFLESLFNVTYLNQKNSEFAIDLLTKSRFTEGIVTGIPNPNLVIAHKFGESGTIKNKELHETALLYLENQPYLITIMTKGKDNVEYPRLATVIQGISSEIYKGLTNLASPNNKSLGKNLPEINFHQIDFIQFIFSETHFAGNSYMLGI